MPLRKRSVSRFCFSRDVAMTQLVFPFIPNSHFFRLFPPLPDLSISLGSQPICLRLTDFFATCSNHPLLMSPAPFFRNQTVLLKPLFPPSVALTSSFFPRADTYEQSDVLTRMVLKKDRRVKRRIF